MIVKDKPTSEFIQGLESTTSLFCDGDWIESKDQDKSGSVRLIQLADVGDGRFINKSNRFMNVETAKRLNCTFLKKGDLLIARMPDPLGRCCIFPFDKEGKYVTVVDVAVLRLKEEFDNNYLKHLINSPQVRHDISCQITGTTRQRITRKKLGKLKVLLPPLAEQKKIAAILDAADQLRQKDQQLIAKYNALSQSLFLDMFGDPVTNPMGWEENDLRIFFSDNPRIGTTTPVNDGGNTKVVRVGELGKKTVEFSKCKKVSLPENEQARYLLNDGDVILARAIGSEHHLGKASLFEDIGFPVVFDSHVMRLRFNKDLLSPLFFYHWLGSNGGRAIFLRNSRQTAVQFNINAKQIARIKINVPSITLQKQFAKHIQIIEAQKQQAQASLQKSEALFNSLLQRAFKGELTC